MNKLNKHEILSIILNEFWRLNITPFYSVNKLGDIDSSLDYKFYIPDDIRKVAKLKELRKTINKKTNLSIDLSWKIHQRKEDSLEISIKVI